MLSLLQLSPFVIFSVSCLSISCFLMPIPVLIPLWFALLSHSFYILSSVYSLLQSFSPVFPYFLFSFPSLRILSLFSRCLSHVLLVLPFFSVLRPCLEFSRFSRYFILSLLSSPFLSACSLLSSFLLSPYLAYFALSFYFLLSYPALYFFSPSLSLLPFTLFSFLLFFPSLTLTHCLFILSNSVCLPLLFRLTSSL